MSKLTRLLHSSGIPDIKNFVVTEKLGSGTYATVYKAYRKTRNRDVVAIKCVLKNSLNKASTENLLREIEILTKLKHENIVELYDFQWDEKYIYLIMEFCSGGDLSRSIGSRQICPRIVKQFFKQIVSAILFLNDSNVAHMDLKPQNILLTSDSPPIVKIADFGFSTHIMEGDREHVMKGSPLYMAPEIICGKSYDARIDLWSIGAILYECLFGIPPFFSRTDINELRKNIKDDRPVELPLDVDVGNHCRDLLKRLLEKDPDARITFEQLAKHPYIDLKHFSSSSGLDKAIGIVKRAVYCETLEQFVPSTHYKKDLKKKEAHRSKMKEYMDRAETLKKILKTQK